MNIRLPANRRKNSQHCWELLAHNVASVLRSFKSLTGFKLSATTPNNMQQDVTGYANGRNMQHPTMLGVVGQQCCVRLHGALGGC